ncbi:MAG: SIMPL domain-containing protein [Congregibacter sp.]|nr:SIMPL domain-containing protein [Congregibacter sp.]MDP5069969.1 SIMPL domain-containing protein [Congregibacter sp.]
MQNTIMAVLIAVGLVIGGAFIGNGLERFRMADRSIVIKGLAEQSVDSDFVTWPLTVRRAGDSFLSVQKSLAADRDKLVEFLHGLGFTSSELEIRPLVVTDAYSREYASSNSPTRYSGAAVVIVNSERVAAVSEAALATDPLIADGVQLDLGTGPSYALRAFNDAKGPLLKAATENAREQAIKFAKESGASLGELKSANQGIIQITGTGGNPYDSASSREKRLRVVSTFEYYLK